MKRVTIQSSDDDGVREGLRKIKGGFSKEPRRVFLKTQYRLSFIFSLLSLHKRY